MAVVRGLATAEPYEAPPPRLPNDLRRMTERQRLALLIYLRGMPLDELMRRQGVIHMYQGEMHAQQKRAGVNSSVRRVLANLDIMDEMYRKAIELAEEDYDEAMETQYGVQQPNWDHRSWGLPHPDPSPFPVNSRGMMPSLEDVERKLERKYNIRAPKGHYPNWRVDDDEQE